ncbi:MAG: Lrp/AsnC family transcriptional regulator [Lachnospiraceae bacterium]|nr:Lrp/AsnC family transcriptional regulator [Lachnospiraceae bacterium]
MKGNELDHVDRKILNILMKEGRKPIREIAADVFLSSPAVSARISALEKSGYITGYCAKIDPAALGYHIKSFIGLEVKPAEKQEFYSYIASVPNVVECNCVTGEYSMLLEVFFPTTAELDRFIGELQTYGRSKTMIVFNTSVEHRGIHLSE